MRTSALIVAAGMSSRMGDFKPMLNLGSITIAQRIVATLQQAGADKVVMVTGYKAQALERHLSNMGIIFLRNEDYDSTHMFDSAKIGLSYLKDKCDRILFTPVDIPLFTCATVKRLMESEASLACPVCDGKTGHPILLSAELVDGILADSGEEGLKGALERSGARMEEIPVSDPGILHDADTPQDYKALLSIHNSQLVRPVVSLALTREKAFFDSRSAMLLSLVEETGSVRSACQRMQLSYSSGWNIIKTLESQLDMTLILRSKGGAKGGQSSLTPEGRDFLRRYDEYLESIKAAAEELYPKYFGGVFK